jgi:hypothetical protein
MLVREQDIGELLANLGWSWDYLIVRWEEETGGKGIIRDHLQRNGEYVFSFNYLAKLAACFSIPVAFLLIIVDSDVESRKLRKYVISYAVAKNTPDC